jgi:hypothetical protein
MKKIFIVVSAFIFQMAIFTNCIKNQSIGQLDSATKLSVKPDKLFFLPGNVITFTGTLTDTQGAGISGAQVGFDDPIRRMCTLSPKTDNFGTFSISFTIPSTAKGNYAYAFYYGNSKSFIAIEVTPQTGKILKNSAQIIPLGVFPLESIFVPTLLIRINSDQGLHYVTPAELRQEVDVIGSFMAGVASNTLVDYASNPVNDVVSVGAIGCIGGIWTGVGTIPCSALYSFIVVQGIKSTIVGTINTIIDKTSMTTADKTDWKDQVKDAKCVVGIATLDPSSAVASLSSIATGWTCGSAISTAYNSPYKSVKLVATPTSTSTNQNVAAIILISSSSIIVPGACDDVQNLYPLGATLTGHQARGFTGDFSCYSDIYNVNGVRISPGSGEGRAYFDYGPVNQASASVTFQWVDNAWWSDTKAVEVFNWKTNLWDRISSWTSNDGLEHISTYGIPIDTDRKGPLGQIRVAIYAGPGAVIHLNSLILN